MKRMLAVAGQLSCHALLLLGATTAAADIRSDVTVGQVRATSTSAAPVTVVDPLSGSRATVQLSATGTCFGLACTVAGPAVGAYGMGTTVVYAVLNYGFSLVGPGPALVPLLVSGIYSNLAPLTAGGNTTSVLTASLSQDATFARFLSTCYDFANPEFRELPAAVNCGAGTYGFGFLASTSGSVAVELAAYIQPFPAASPNQISAFIDPFIEIDPVWLAANPGYSLAFDSGVANVPGGLPVSPVPEPATVAMLAAGLAGLAVRRRKRRN